MLHNEIIIKAPVAFFLGAGASQPLGKMLMKPFISYLRGLEAIGNLQLFKEIVSSEENGDLEFLFEELDDWKRKTYVKRYRMLPDRQEPAFLSEQVAREAFGLERALKREVYNAYRSIGKPSDTVELFGPVFETVFRELDVRESPLVIFTTNYDPAIEEFAEQEADAYVLEDGFFQRGGAFLWSAEQFHRFSVNGKKRALVLFKLHGSASWIRTAKGIVRSPVSVYLEADPQHENVIVYPAKRKIADHEPFFTAYDYFQRCMERAKLCIVIGYSFRDYDALSKLMSASLYNQSLKLLIVDPNAEAICKDLAARGVRAAPVAKVFGFDAQKAEYLGAIEGALGHVST